MPTAVMRYQTEIGLTDAQRTTITNEITEAQKRVVDLRWQLEAKDAAFGKLLGADKIDEPAAHGAGHRADDARRADEARASRAADPREERAHARAAGEAAHPGTAAPRPLRRRRPGGPPDDDMP
jgi:hypothetical protein